MKTISLLSAILLLFIGTSLHAQSQYNLNDLLSRLDQNHMGSVHDVFTPDELVVLRQHFDANNQQQIPSIQGGGVEVFAPENSNDNFGHFNTGDPSIFNNIGPAGGNDFEGAGAFDPITGLFFMINNSGWAYNINPADGTYSLLGILTPPTGENYTGLSFNPVDQKMYGISTDGAGTSSISSINTTTLDIDVIGNTGITLAIALAIDAIGNAYAYDIDLDLLYVITLATAVAISVGSIGFDASFGQGMTIDPSSGIMYMTAFNNTTFQSELRTVNTSTGNTNLIGPIGNVSPGGLLQFGWCSTSISPLGITDHSFSNFILYPNPAEDRLHISAEAVIEEVEIYTMLGQSVSSQTILASSRVLDVSYLSEGTYILTVTIDGRRESFPFIKE